MKDSTRRVSAGAPGPVYGLGLIGALVYFVPLSDGFWSFILAVLKSLVWPAFLVHDVMKFVS